MCAHSVCAPVQDQPIEDVLRRCASGTQQIYRTKIDGQMGKLHKGVVIGDREEPSRSESMACMAKP